MRPFFKNRNTEIGLAIFIFILGWVGAFTGTWLGMAHWDFILFANAGMAGGFLMGIHAFYSEKPFVRVYSEIKLAILLLVVGWIGIFFPGSGWGILIASNLLIAAGLGILVYAKFMEKEKIPVT